MSVYDNVVGMEEILDDIIVETTEMIEKVNEDLIDLEANPNAETINRIISVFPPHQQKQIRIQLAGVLKAVISMRLVTTKDGAGRVPAVEVLRATSYIRDCIENKEKTKLIPMAIAAGKSQYGMQTFDQSLFELFKTDLITYEEALRHATNADEFRLKVDGIHSTSDMLNEDASEFNPGDDSPFEFSPG